MIDLKKYFETSGWAEQIPSHDELDLSEVGERDSLDKQIEIDIEGFTLIVEAFFSGVCTSSDAGDWDTEPSSEEEFNVEVYGALIINKENDEEENLTSDQLKAIEEYLKKFF